MDTKATIAFARSPSPVPAGAPAESQELRLAAQVQRTMLPPRAFVGDRTFYTTLWRPKDAVSGDFYEALPIAGGDWLYVLGDVQGHGTVAAMAMMAVQGFLRQLSRLEDLRELGPADVANALQGFVASNLGAVSYLTALVCFHRPAEGVVDWISCGAPDPAVVDPDDPAPRDINPEKRGGLPVGLLPDTVYTAADAVRTPLAGAAVFAAWTDGVLDLARGPDGAGPMPDDLRRRVRDGLLLHARRNGSVFAAPWKFLAACGEQGYGECPDDVTQLVFGPRLAKPGVLELSVPVQAGAIDRAAERIGEWCAAQGWGVAAAAKVQIVFQEKLMNVHDHGLDPGDRVRETACARLRRAGADAELSVWDCGAPEPEPAEIPGGVAAALERRNREFSPRGRGLLMLREICSSIRLDRYGDLNESVYTIPLGDPEPAR